MNEENIKRQEIKKRSRRKKLSVSATIFLVVMMAYPIFEFLVSWIFVKFNSMLLAFQLPTGEWSLLSFKAVFLEMFDPEATFSLKVSIRNTFLWLSMDIVMLFFHYCIAYFFYRRIKGTRVFQIVFYLPGILSSVVLVTVFKNFILTSGPLGDILRAIGVENVPQLLADVDYANKTVMFYRFWVGWGGHMLLLGGALARVPLEVIESARIDGVGMFREMFQIIFPMIWSSFSTMIILLFTGIFGVSDTLLLLTSGYNGTTTVGYWIFHRTYFDGPSAYNMVSAAGLLFTVIGAAIAMFIRWLVERIPAVEY